MNPTDHDTAAIIDKRLIQHRLLRHRKMGYHAASIHSSSKSHDGQVKRNELNADH